LMARVQTAYAFIGAEAERREQVETAAYQVPERVTPERIAAEQDYVGSQNERSQPDPERSPTGHRVGEPERFPDIEDEARQEQERQVEKIAMNVLENQGKPPLAAVCIARLAHCTGGRIRPESPVIGAAVIIAGEAKQPRSPKDQQCGRPRQPRRPPGKLRTEPAVRRVAEQLGRVEGR